MATQKIEVTSPLWRVLGVMLAAGSLAALGYYLNVMGNVDNFATIAAVTFFYTLGFWAAKRPDLVGRRFGPFSKIALAVRESREDIQRWVYEKPLAAGICVAILYGVAVVLVKMVFVVGIRQIASPWLAVVLGCAIGAVVSAPDFFLKVLRKPKPEQEVESDVDSGR